MITATASGSGTSPGSIILTIVIIVVSILGYWTPTFVAWLRHVPNLGSVVVLNGFLGWSVVGWVVALAMACRSIPPAPAAPPANWPPPAPGHWPGNGGDTA